MRHRDGNDRATGNWSNARRVFAALAILLPAAAGPAFGQSGWQWRPMPMVTKAAAAVGCQPGGEGCQFPQIIAIDAIDGSFILYGTDVGGLWRSTDGGQLFRPCNVGVETCGAVGFAIDPKNKDRCLAVGDGGGNQFNIYGGVHLSTDRGATWNRKLAKWLNGMEKGREQIAYDPGSYDARLGYCKVAYWIEQKNPQERGGNLYKSTDGGTTWSVRAAPGQYGGDDDAHSLLKLHPTAGHVYVANKNGFYRSTDGGATFARVLEGDFKSLDVVPSLPNTVWTAKAGTATIYKSTDSGATFASSTASGIGGIRALKVSPANSKHMLAADSAHNKRRCYSTDGGATWKVGGKDLAGSWVPPGILYDDRCASHVWHPTEADTAWGIGPGDIITKTTDAGATFRWAGNGDNGIMLGGGFNFNARNPDVVYFGSQDYNGGLTTDGGKTWKFINLSVHNRDGDPWGWVYGGYAADGQVAFGGNRAFNEQKHDLWITFDGGRTSQRKVTGLTGLQVSYGDPTDANVLFCWAYRSADKGVQWARMTGCQGVLTHDPAAKTLYGADGKNVVQSSDRGATWSVVCTLDHDVRDVACDHLRKRLWAVTSGKLWKCEAPAYRPIHVSQPNGAAASVAVDPTDTNLVYVAGTAGTWRKSDSTAVRSTDGGGKWEKLNNRTDLGYDGGNCASWCRVHPATRDLWVGTCCYGFWRFTQTSPR